MHVFARSSRLLAVAATGAVLMLTACTPTPAAPPTPTSAPPTSADPSPTPEPYTGPVIFVGDELDLFLPTPEQVTSIIPDATGMSASSARLEQISDGGGAAAKPAICDALYAEQSLGSVGARSMSWQTPGDGDVSPVRLLALQFPDEEHAQARMDQLLQAAEQCASFTKEGKVTFDTEIADETDNAQAFAGTLIDGTLNWRAFYGFASAGNVLVQLVQPISGDQEYDAEAAATLLRDRAERAHGALVEKLTETAPTDTAPPAADADAPWGEWQISAEGVGPILLGEKVETAIDAVPNATVVKPDYPGGEWTLTSADRNGTLRVLSQEDGDAVMRVTVGLTQIYGDTAVPEGAKLPAVGDVRVGSAASEAIAAHPGGTTVSVVSSAEEWYAVADRDGRLIRFRTDRVATDPQAKIIGISVDDATLWKAMSFTE